MGLPEPTHVAGQAAIDPGPALGTLYNREGKRSTDWFLRILDLCTLSRSRHIA